MMENGERLIDQVENSEESKAWAREWTEAQTNEIENQVLRFVFEIFRYTVNCSYTGLVGTENLSPVYKKFGISE